MSTATTQVGQSGVLLRSWRERRRLSQLDLALRAGVSARHVSFIETGRAQPSRAMLDRLGEHLEIPLRDRNQILISAGYAPAYPQNDLDTDAMTQVREALDQLLASHEPYPAVVVDRRWDLVTGNHSALGLLEGVDPQLLTPPINTLRLTLHPGGLASRLVNLAEYREHLLARLRRLVMTTGDEDLSDLYQELVAYPAPCPPPTPIGNPEIFVPMRLRQNGQELAFFSTITTFGTALDVTLAELVIESFFPADPETSRFLREAHEKQLTAES
jgi:transcriptional regulator with XRE-family HTH domain